MPMAGKARSWQRRGWEGVEVMVGSGLGEGRRPLASCLARGRRARRAFVQTGTRPTSPERKPAFADLRCALSGQISGLCPQAAVGVLLSQRRGPRRSLRARLLPPRIQTTLPSMLQVRALRDVDLLGRV